MTEKENITDQLVSDRGFEESPENSAALSLGAKIINSTKAAVVAAELLPINEVMRYSVLASTQAATGSPALAAVAYGASTFAIESSAALAAADWVAKDRVRDFIDRISERLSKTRFAFAAPQRFIPERIRLSRTAEAGIALTLGSVAVMEAKQRENPHRTAAENRRYGLQTATWLGAFCTAEGALISNGFDNITQPIGPALLGVAALSMFAGKLRGKEAKQDDGS